jgi:cytochrome oxidase assembly protein ShyY1
VYRFLLSRRWLGFAVFAVVVAGVCIRLGMWQFDRLDERRADNHRIEANLAVDPSPVTGVVSAGGSVDSGDEWRQVTATGHFDSSQQVILSQQTREVGPGVDVLTPLVLPEGVAVIVDRGWLAINSPSEVPTPPPAPTGPVKVTGWLRVDSDADSWATTPEDDGTVRAVDSGDLAGSLPYDVLPGWIAMTSQQPPAHDALAAPEAPDLGDGPHFFYGLQWWFFAALAVFGFGYLAYDERRKLRRPAAGGHDRTDGRAETAAVDAKGAPPS